MYRSDRFATARTPPDRIPTRAIRAQTAQGRTLTWTLAHPRRYRDWDRRSMAILEPASDANSHQCAARSHSVSFGAQTIASLRAQYARSGPRGVGRRPWVPLPASPGLAIASGEIPKVGEEGGLGTGLKLPFGVAYDPGRRRPRFAICQLPLLRPARRGQCVRLGRLPRRQLRL